MEKTICINGVEKQLNVEKKDGTYRFSIGDKNYIVKAESLSNGTLAFFVDARSYVAHVSRAAGGSRIALGGSNFFVEGDADDGGRQSTGGSAHSDGKIESPMPGNIISVQVSEGDAVEADQAVVVIESMKMQNEINSPVAGQVARVHCSVGDQVNFGEVLVEITPDE